MKSSVMYYLAAAVLILSFCWPVFGDDFSSIEVTIIDYASEKDMYDLDIDDKPYIAVSGEKAMELALLNKQIQIKEARIKMLEAQLEDYEDLKQHYKEVIDEGLEVVKVKNEYIDALEKNIVLYKELAATYDQLAIKKKYGVVGSIGYVSGENHNFAAQFGIHIDFITAGAYLFNGNWGGFVGVVLPLF